MKKPKRSWAQLIGGGLAYAQHAGDCAVTWCFRTLRSAGESRESRQASKRHPVLRGAQRAGKGVLAFLGQLGDSYYEKYGELKSRRK